jgi:transposase
VDVVIEKCAGIDVHKDQVTVCVLVGSPEKKPTSQIRVFRTFTKELLELGEWLVSLGVTAVGMESTGVYWKPVYAVLEGFEQLALTVGNANHIKNVPGRKTDVKDSEWIAKLMRHGLVSKSFVPPPDIRELRDLTRYRRSLVQDRTSKKNRLQKLLESANVKLGSVVSDVFGATGLAIVEALAEGKSDVLELAQLARGNLRAKKAELALSVDCRMTLHHRELLKLQLEDLKHSEQLIAKVEGEIDRRLEPYRAQIKNLRTITGVQQHAAAGMLAELGTNMAVFRGADHCAAWAGITPGNNESAGKRGRQPLRKGNLHLRNVLIEAANAAVRTKNTYFRDKYFRMGARMPKNKAKVAIAHKVLLAAFHILKDGSTFKELGPNYLDSVDRRRTTKNLVRRLEQLGHHVTLAPTG